MKNILKISSILLLLIVLGSCQDKTSQNNEGDETRDENNKEKGGEQEEEEETTSTLTLRLEQLDVMNIELGSIQQKNLGATLKVNGQLELPPQNMASVSAIVGGRVQSVRVIEGDYVKKGQIIAQLNNPEFITMQREYLRQKVIFLFWKKIINVKKNF